MSGLYADIARPRLDAGGEDGGRGLRRGREGHEGRGRLGRPPEQGRRRLQHRAPVVRRRQGRRDLRRAELGGGAGRQPDHARKEQGVPRLRRGVLGPDRQGLLAEHGPLDLRHLDAGQRHRQGDRQDRRRHLVLPHRRLRLRPRARARHRGRGAEERRQGARQGPPPARTRRTSPRSCCRRRRPRPRSSAWPMPAATRSTRSSRRPSSASSRAARTWPACWCSSPTSTRSGSTRRRA